MSKNIDIMEKPLFEIYQEVYVIAGDDFYKTEIKGVEFHSYEIIEGKSKPIYMYKIKGIERVFENYWEKEFMLGKTFFIDKTELIKFVTSNAMTTLTNNIERINSL